ncbi:MAG TPA: PH domain-containing protein [Bryobacteraceae bacterium]|nr:PH domain-containing protein [Bryobacteraceae bacterium]
MTFSASYDRFTKILSSAVCAGMLAVIVFSHSIIIAALALVVMFIAFAYSPRSYTIEGRAILVRRLAGSARIALDDVREVRRATSGDSQGSIRLRGSGGLFGYYGLFRSAALGDFTAYMTSRKNNVVLITGAQTVLFSPDDVDGFLSAIQTVAPSSGTRGAPPIAIRRRSLAIPIAAAVAVGGVALALAISAFLYSPGPPAYTLTSTLLTIRDRFYPVTLQRSNIDIAGIRIVDLAAEPQWRPTLRTDGFANSHYQSGWFRIGNGQKVRMYRAGGDRLVLIPSNNSGAATVLYQAEDPDRFLAAIRAAWMNGNERK